MTERIGPGPTGRYAVPNHIVDGKVLAWSVFDEYGTEYADVLLEADARLLVYGSPYGGLSDEEAGRRWCAAHGKRPEQCTRTWPTDRTVWAWNPEADFGVGPHNLRYDLFEAVRPADHGGVQTGWVITCTLDFPTEETAYAAIGAVLKRAAEVLQ